MEAIIPRLFRPLWLLLGDPSALPRAVYVAAFSSSMTDMVASEAAALPAPVDLYDVCCGIGTIGL